MVLNRLKFLALAILLTLGVSAAHALPVISELYYDAPGSDNGLVFVELFGLPGTDLSGLTLEGVNGANGSVGPVVALSGTIPGDGLFVVADDDGSGATSVLNADLIVNFDFQNGPDSVELRQGALVVDALGYGSFGVGEVFAGEGSPAPDAPAGSSLARVFADLDSDDNATDFAVQSMPSPGSAPLALPEPRSRLLLLSGLGGLAWRGRPRSRSVPS